MLAKAWQPTFVTACKLWLRADDLAGNDGDAIATFTDRTANANFVQATGAKKPILKRAIVGGHSVLRFDGAATFMTSAFDMTGAKTTCVVYRLNAAIGATVISGWSFKHTTSFSEFLIGNTGTWKKWIYLHDFSGATAHCGQDNSLDTTVHRSIHTYNAGTNTSAGSYTWNVDGAAVTSLSSSNTLSRTGTDVSSLGARCDNANTGSLFLPVDIAEVMVWNSVLSATNQAAVSAYLKSYYQL